MHQRLAEAIEYIERIRADLLRSFEAVNPERLTEKPGAGAWSAAEVIDHLRIVENGIARLFAKRIGQAREAGLHTETSTASILDSLDHMGEMLDHGRIEAPATVRPAEQPDPTEAIAGLRASREALLASLQRGDGLALGEIRHTHPLLGELDLY